MARNKGTFDYPANLEARISAPLDAKMLVKLKSDLINSTQWQSNEGDVWTYKGMVVSVSEDPSTENNGLYFLNDTDYTNVNNWIKLVSVDASLIVNKLNNYGPDTFNGTLTINGSINLFGDIIQDGSNYVTHAEQIYTEKDFIILRDKAISPIADGSISGIEILKANGTNNVILGSDASAVLRIGWEGDTLQAIATREDHPINNGYAYWNDSSSMFKTYDLKGYVDGSLSRRDVSFGSGGQIPFMNNSSTNFSYSNNFSWNGNNLLVKSSLGDSLFIGENVGLNIVTGNILNTYLGNNSGHDSTNCANNVFVGYATGYKNITGSANTFIGKAAGYSSTTGTFDVYIGYEAGYNNTYGSRNTFVGYRSGELSKGNSNIFIGYMSGGTVDSSNKLYIENSASNQPLIYGEFDNNLVRINGNLDVSDNLSVDNSVYFIGIKNASTNKILYYDTTSKEISYQDASFGGYSQGTIGNINYADGNGGWSSSSLSLGANTITNSSGAVGIESIQILSSTIQTNGSTTIYITPGNGSLVINASTSLFNGRIDISNNLTVDNSVYFNGIKNASTNKVLYYNTTSKEISYEDASFGSSISLGTVAQIPYMDLMSDKFTYSDDFTWNGQVLTMNLYTISNNSGTYGHALDGTTVLDFNTNQSRILYHGDATNKNITIDTNSLQLNHNGKIFAGAYSDVNTYFGIKDSNETTRNFSLAIANPISNTNIFSVSPDGHTYIGASLISDTSVYFTGIKEGSTNKVLFYNDQNGELSYADASFGSSNVTDASVNYLYEWNTIQDNSISSLLTAINDSSSFISLSDTPSNYLAGKLVAVNDASNGLEYVSRVWRENANVVTLDNDAANVLFYDYIELEADGGEATLVDKNVTSSSGAGLEESYNLKLNNENMLKIYGISTGDGSLNDSKGVSITTNYFYIGDPASDAATNFCWRFYITDDVSGNLVVQKRNTSGDWVESQRFI